MRKLRELAQRSPGSVVAPGLVITGGEEALPLGDDRIVPWHGIAEALAAAP